jgi:hypothetical protein
LADFVVPEDNPVFANTQAPETGKLSCQCSYVTFLAGVYVVQGAAYILPDAGMLLLEGCDDLVREFQAGTSSDGR